ncbi:T9SS type A sorting domain-containing protein [bacterium]|nr:T9SS type A sorting domain-containing protein [bacterium]MBU1983081.1 T9SS type A sorting domain-containing protein [bacterium]
MVDLTQDGIFELELTAYYTGPEYRGTTKILDITTGNALLLLDDPNLSCYLWEVVDYDQDGILECIFSASDEIDDTHGWIVYNTGVSGNVSESPAGRRDFHLRQNYPNPFNPSTRIEYSLSAPGQVELEIFNSLGQKVSSLVNAWQPPGTHTAVWNSGTDGKALSSGSYFYQLNVDGKPSDARKMILLK